MIRCYEVTRLATSIERRKRLVRRLDAIAWTCVIGSAVCFVLAMVVR